MRRPPSSALFPYTTLFRSIEVCRADLHGARACKKILDGIFGFADAAQSNHRNLYGMGALIHHAQGDRPDGRSGKPDRKSTRLNSSHVEISYAVFCLKKKKK